MDGFILTTWPLLWLGLGLSLLVIVLYMLYKQWWIGAVITLVIALPFFAFWLHASTHVLVTVNTVVLVEDTYTGKVVGEQLTSGVGDVPFLTGRVHVYSAQPRLEWCDEFHPAIGGSIAAIVKPCFYLDASSIDWKKQVVRNNTYDQGKIFQVWKSTVGQKIADAVHDRTAEQMSRHEETAKAMFDKVKPFFAEEGINLTSVVLTFWDFENPEIGKAYDQAAVAQTAKMKAEADFAAAKVERETALYRADTQNQVLAEQAKMLSKVLDLLGIADSQSRAGVLRFKLLIDYLSSHPGTTVIVNTGGDTGVAPTLAQPKAVDLPQADKK